MLEPNELEIEIIPGILEKEWSEIEKKIQLVESFAQIIHIDLLDGKFAPNTTWTDAGPFAKFTKERTYEVHLMVENPITYLDAWANAGFKRFIGQIEKMPDISSFVAKAQNLGEVGLAVDTQTQIEKIFPYIEDLDFAFVMTVKAGFSRQSFLPEMLEKVKKLREKAEFLPIEIDGGINDQNIIEAKKVAETAGGIIFENIAKEKAEAVKKQLEENAHLRKNSNNFVAMEFNYRVAPHYWIGIQVADKKKGTWVLNENRLESLLKDLLSISMS